MTGVLRAMEVGDHLRNFSRLSAAHNPSLAGGGGMSLVIFLRLPYTVFTFTQSFDSSNGEPSRFSQ
jgi:hypothetical protein